MERFVLSVPSKDGKRFLAAAYDMTGNGILFTDVEEDACSYVSMDAAVLIAKELNSLHGYDVSVSVSKDGR